MKNKLKGALIGSSTKVLPVDLPVGHEGVKAKLIIKGALSRYSVIFCAILLWGKIMAAVHLSKRSALNKCPACRFS